MEPAKIDWKSIQWRFVEDELYEHINAPKWVDFTAIHDPVDDEGWFCRPDCKHPKTAEELLRGTPSKLTSSAYSPGILQLSDRIQRVAKLKRRVPTQPSNSSNSENENPNFSTPPNHHAAKPTKAEIKSSAEKKPLVDDRQQKKSNETPPPLLKNTLSARNLFAGRDILNQITEFCNEIKRMATRVRERENVKQPIVGYGVEAEKKSGEKDLNSLERKERERKPFVELGKQKSDGTIGSNSVKHKQKINNIKFAVDSENVPISVELEKVWHKREGSLLQIRTNPPSPQCFSNTRAPNKITPSKASKSRNLKEKEILEEVEKKIQVSNEESADRVKIISAIAEKEARTLDVLWFLKPCTLSS